MHRIRNEDFNSRSLGGRDAHRRRVAKLIQRSAIRQGAHSAARGDYDPGEVTSERCAAIQERVRAAVRPGGARVDVHAWREDM